MRKALRKVVIVVGFLMALEMADGLICPKAEASYGARNALETVGIATGIGAVIGLSTISFYDQPTAHLTNALMGAGAGMILGLGVAAYLLSNSTEDEISPEEVLPPQKRLNDSELKKTEPGKQLEKKMKNSQYRFRGVVPQESVSLALASVPVTQTLQNASSLNRGWAISMRVLELRF